MIEPRALIRTALAGAERPASRRAFRPNAPCWRTSSRRGRTSRSSSSTRATTSPKRLPRPAGRRLGTESRHIAGGGAAGGTLAGGEQRRRAAGGTRWSRSLRHSTGTTSGSRRCGATSRRPARGCTKSSRSGCRAAGRSSGSARWPRGPPATSGRMRGNTTYHCCRSTSRGIRASAASRARRCRSTRRIPVRDAGPAEAGVRDPRPGQV